MERESFRIGIVSFPLDKANIPVLLNFISITGNISKEVHIITGGVCTMLYANYDKLHIHLVDYKTEGNYFTKYINYICSQLRIICKLLIVSRNVDFWLFPIGAESQLPAILIARLLGKIPVLSLTSFPKKMLEGKKNVISKLALFFISINLTLAKKIVVKSERHIGEWNLQKYKHKISIAHHHFFDLDKFKINRAFTERGTRIGYIGRLSEEKGIANFISAIPKIMNRNDKIKFLIGGEGPLRSKVEQYLVKQNLKYNVRFAGWIPHSEIPSYLNELELFVLPSYTEGLPFIILEAMACGTPVLSTPVGAIPDVIKDGETGFLLENNSPKCIEKNVIRALNHPNIEQIIKNGRATIERKFSFENAVEGYRKILTKP
jgi:glycosyltransferase involved in cell wall biosynthesis